jgi:hypothetical protein
VSQDYYALYDKITLIPKSISGTPFIDIPDGYASAQINERHGAHVMTGTGHMQDYFVHITDKEHAELKYRLTEIVSHRVALSDNVVQDLSYRIILIDLLNIQYTHKNNQLILTFDIDSLLPENQQKFYSSVQSENNNFSLVITEYRDIALITKFQFDLLKLSNDKSLTLPLITNKRISVWATR